MNVSLIIAAGGAGKRFLGRKSRGTARRVPTSVCPSKLFFPIAGKPLLAHTLESFKGISQIDEIIVAVPRGTESWVKSRVLHGLRQGRGGVSPPSGRGDRAPTVRLVRGGATRAESVWNALQRTSPKNEWVLVHDGARPFPPREEIMKMLQLACRSGVSPPSGRGDRAPTDGIILARPVVPTLKRVARNGQICETVDRSNLFEAETPQLVRRSLLLRAYEKYYCVGAGLKPAPTDESSLIESIGKRIKIHSHTGWNVKVTTPEDLSLAEAYYSHCRGEVSSPFDGRGNPAPTLKIGFGRDTHRLVLGRKLYLGGIRIPSEKGALGHSDGDALLHAVSDAILGAIGSGDIGEWFSDKNPRYKGIRSEKILKRILEEAERKGWAPQQIDSVITLERPRLGNRKREIKKKLARMTDLAEELVSVKAKTREGLGPEGEGMAVTCEALVLLSRRGGVAPPLGRGDRAPTVRNSIL